MRSTVMVMAILGGLAQPSIESAFVLPSIPPAARLAAIRRAVAPQCSIHF